MIVQLYVKLKEVCKNEKGTSAVEYAILVAFIAAVIIGVVTILGIKANDAFQPVVSGLK